MFLVYEGTCPGPIRLQVFVGAEMFNYLSDLASGKGLCDVPACLVEGAKNLLPGDDGLKYPYFG